MSTNSPMARALQTTFIPPAGFYFTKRLLPPLMAVSCHFCTGEKNHWNKCPETELSGLLLPTFRLWLRTKPTYIIYYITFFIFNANTGKSVHSLGPDWQDFVLRHKPSQWWTGCYLPEQRADCLSKLICKQRSREKQKQNKARQNKTKIQSPLKRRVSSENALSRGALFPGKLLFSGFSRKKTASVICVSVYCCEFLCIFSLYSWEGLNLNSGIW